MIRLMIYIIRWLLTDMLALSDSLYVALGYYHIKNEMKPYCGLGCRSCNPAVIPFAGWINSDRGDNKSNLEYTGDNFVHCTQTILQEITEYAFQPIYYVMSVFTDMFKEMSEAINNARAMFNRVRNTVKKQTGDIDSLAFLLNNDD